MKKKAEMQEEERVKVNNCQFLWGTFSFSNTTLAALYLDSLLLMVLSIASFHKHECLDE